MKQDWGAKLGSSSTSENPSIIPKRCCNAGPPHPAAGPALQAPWACSRTTLLCKSKRQYLLTCEVSRYCILPCTAQHVGLQWLRQTSIIARAIDLLGDFQPFGCCASVANIGTTFKQRSPMSCTGWILKLEIFQFYNRFSMFNRYGTTLCLFSHVDDFQYWGFQCDISSYTAHGTWSTVENWLSSATAVSLFLRHVTKHSHCGKYPMRFLVYCYF